MQYFGENNPNAFANVDPDGDGQTNLFEWTAGLLPNNASSRFAFHVAAGPSVGTVNLTFQPIVTGRSYNVRFKTNLAAPGWNPLTGTTQIDNGAVRSVTDPAASGGTKYYDVQISKP